MAEFHSNGNYGNYESYLAQMFNPAVGGQYNPGVFGSIGSGLGAVPGATFAPQNPWAVPQLNTLWPQQQVAHPVQLAIQAAQQIAARQAAHAIQCAQALQQIVQHLTAQQYAQQTMGWQPQFGQGLGAAFGAGQIGQAIPQSYAYGWGAQNPIHQALQQQAMPQLAPYLAAQQQQAMPQLAPYLAAQQQPGQFRQGWVN